MRELDAHRHFGGQVPSTIQGVVQSSGRAVIPQSQALRGDAATCGHRRGFDDEQTSPAVEHIAPVHQVPVCGETVVGGVLTHGGHHSAIGQGQGAAWGGQGEFRKEMAQGDSRNKDACDGGRR